MFSGKESSIILISSRVIEIWCFGLPVALGRGQVGGGVSGGIWGHGVSPHAYTCMHMHTHTCIELQMAASMEASMFSMFSMFNMHVHACVHVRVHACVCVYAWDTPHTPILPPPPSTHLPPTPREMDPRNHLKFDNTSTYQDISIPFEDLTSVKNSPPMGGCVIWWVGGWLGGWVG